MPPTSCPVFCLFRRAFSRTTGKPSPKSGSGCGGLSSTSSVTEFIHEACINSGPRLAAASRRIGLRRRARRRCGAHYPPHSRATDAPVLTPHCNRGFLSVLLILCVRERDSGRKAASLHPHIKKARSECLVSVVVIAHAKRLLRCLCALGCCATHQSEQCGSSGCQLTLPSL